HAARLPDTLETAGRVLARLETASQDGFRLSEASIEAIGRAEGRGNRTGSLALWALVALAAYAVFFGG
ncbi:MAG TPA: ubiquinone biosynthesis protein UbiB, partial [Beijerinckiaceae bacterium]|nr:ubiquinone biosynthesis protein UbiB [Beijerinckiaceae bacterium]